MTSLLSALVAWVITTPSRAIQGTISALTTKPSWPRAFSLAVTLLKAGAWSVPRHVRTARLLTDHSMPGMLLPRGVHMAYKVLVAACGEDENDEPALYGEIASPIVSHTSNNDDDQLLLSATCSGTPEAVNGDVATTKSPTATKKEPRAAAQKLPLAPGTVILYAHGGAYCLCSPATHRRLLAELCVRTGCKVVSVDYRRPPEHPCPTAVNDVLRAYMHLTEAPHGVDPSRVIFAGDSAGGGLCLAVLAALRHNKRRLLSSHDLPCAQPIATAEALSAEKVRALDGNSDCLCSREKSCSSRSRSSGQFVSSCIDRSSARDGSRSPCSVATAPPQPSKDDYNGPSIAPRGSSHATLSLTNNANELPPPPPRLRLPAGAVLLSPWCDLSEDTSQGTWIEHGPFDFLPPDLVHYFAAAYANGYSLADLQAPVASPLFADLRGLPPLLIEVGGCEALLGQAQRLKVACTKAGVKCQLHVSADMVHLFQILTGLGAPEPGASLNRVAAFVHECTSSGGTASTATIGHREGLLCAV